jgi:hypothetical protein
MDNKKLAAVLRQDEFAPDELSNGQGMKFYGVRHDSPTVKGSGWMGPMASKFGDVSTEISGYSNGIGDYPLMAPTITPEQLKSLLAGNDPTDEIYQNAENWAKARQAQGLSPFAQSNELTLSNTQGLNPNRLKGIYK